MHSPICCMNDNWDNFLNLRHTLDRIHLASILEFNTFRYGWGSVMCKETNTTIGPYRIRLFAHIIRLQSNKEKLALLGDTNNIYIYIYIWYIKPTAYMMLQPLQTHSHGTMWRQWEWLVIRWVINRSSRSSIIKWVSSTYTTPYIAKKITKVT